jgi:xanthine/CO dehydrogenase XdhC/CoxF family maturation factor
MSELRQILGLWERAKAQGEEVCLATVVRVQGSSYRKPGARMLLTSGGQRAGTISGGCLEAEVSKKAWWLTESGPTVQEYSSFFAEDSGIPYGLGCGGTVWVLLERGPAAESVLEALRRGIEERSSFAVVTSVGAEGYCIGTQLVIAEDGERLLDAVASGAGEVNELADGALREKSSQVNDNFFVEYLAPPPSLYLFGAGDDAVPLVEFAHALGWYITVIDGRSNLARQERFPLADRWIVHKASDGLSQSGIEPGIRDAAVIMTHSYQQDAEFLKKLLPCELAYLGILGPRLRTQRLLKEIAPDIGLSIEECMERLHAPIGLNLGAANPAGIALAIAAEIQAVFAGCDSGLSPNVTGKFLSSSHA